MRPLIDQEGRIGGRFNVVDLLSLAFLCGLIPVAYSSWLLFHPADAKIHSVEHSNITSAEERIAAGQPIRMKVKVRGEHLTPVLRAYIGLVPAMGFTFEGPTSADVIVGENVPPGTHDLILYDGPREVARAHGAITVPSTAGAMLLLVGAFTQLDKRTAESLHVGQQVRSTGPAMAEIVALGGITTDRREVKQGSGAIQTSHPDTWARESIVRIQCDPNTDLSRCRVGGTMVGESTPVVVSLPTAGSTYQMRVDGIVPDVAPTPAVVRVRLEGSALAAGGIRPGDRDMRWPAVDERAAVVHRVERLGSAGSLDIYLRMGLDRATDGWRYHAQAVVAGAPFNFTTDRYAVHGTIVEMVIDGQF